MPKNYDNDDTYIIPHNYTDNGKILGIIEVSSLYFASLWFIPTTIINFMLNIPTDMKIIFFIILIAPPTLIALVGIGSDTLHDFIVYVYKYYQNAKFYTYEKK